MALGVQGLVVPLLPTTPFLLLAAACLARGSRRLSGWLLTNRCFGSYIADNGEGRGVTLRHKIAAMALLWLMIGYAAGFAVEAWWTKLLLLGVAAAVTARLARPKTYRPEPLALLPASEPMLPTLPPTAL